MTWRYEKTVTGIEIRDSHGAAVATVHTGTSHAREIVAAHNAIVAAQDALASAKAGMAEPGADRDALAHEARDARAFLRRVRT